MYPIIDPIPMPPEARSALVVVDMQRFFFRLPDRRIGLDSVVENINRLISHFDRSALPVCHVITAYQPDRSDWDIKMKIWGTCELVAGTPDAEMLPEIRCLPDHLVLTKTRYNAFHSTGLAEQLRARQVSRVMVVGAYTHYCVYETAIAAYAYDFIPGVITDAVISNFPNEAEMMLSRMARNGYHLMTTSEYLKSGGVINHG